MTITAEQYRFFKFCLENNNTKSERQLNYFTKAINEYESENCEIIPKGLNWIDYFEFLTIGIITIVMYNVYFKDTVSNTF